MSDAISPTTLENEALNCTKSELCTYLRELAAGYLAMPYSDTNAFAQSKSMRIASKSYQQGKKTVKFHGFPSLAMSKRLKGPNGEDWLISYRAAFRVRISASQEKVRGSPAKGLDYGKNSLVLLAKLCQRKFLSRTAQCSLLEDSKQLFVTLPKWGTLVDGELFRPP